MIDIRDGEPVKMDLPKGVEAFKQPDGQIALWNGKGHVIIPPNVSTEGLKAALYNLGFAS